MVAGVGGGLRQDGPGLGREAQVREPRTQEQTPDGADLQAAGAPLHPHPIPGRAGGRVSPPGVHRQEQNMRPAPTTATGARQARCRAAFQETGRRDSEAGMLGPS